MINLIINLLTSKKVNTFLVFLGESNSGGYANNADAIPSEIAETDVIKIWDNVSETEFDNLKISNPNSNNLLGHAGLASSIGVTHGWELELTNRIKAGAFGENNIFLCKCGQGGTVIANWVDDVLYAGINPRIIFETRVADAFAEIAAINSLDTETHVFFSLGINDAIAVTDPAVWKTKMLTFISNIRVHLGNVNIYATQIMPENANYIAINDKILELDTELSYFTAITTSDATQKDINHWDYDGMKLIAGRMINKII